MDFFEQDEYYRRKERVAAAEAQNAAWRLQEAEYAKLRKIAADRLSERANQSFLLHEYTSRGVPPPFTDLDGMPTVSLALLLDMGWRIEQAGHETALVLVRPLADPPRNRRRRQDYDQNT